MKKFSYYKQETNYTCGAAAMRMALESFGIRRSEKQVARVLKTNKVRGTWPRNFTPVAERFKLNHATMRNATIKDLKEFQKKGYIIIVCYSPTGITCDHYSVVKRVDNKKIYLLDPDIGEDHEYSLTFFRRIWKCDPRYDDERGWFFAVKK